MIPSRFPPQLHVFVRDWMSANSIVLKSRDGHVLIDSGYVRHEQLTLALLATERGIGSDPLAWLVNTHCHSDHVGGNAAIAARYGCPVAVPQGEAPLVERRDQKACCTTKDVTLLDLAGAFGGKRFDPALIKTLIDIVEVINALPTDGSNIIIGFGDFYISGPNAPAGGVDLRDSSAKLSDAPAPGAGSFDLDDQIANPTGRKKGGTGSSGPSTGTQGFMSKLKNLGGSGLSLPILTEPSNIFGLLTGKVVDLVVWDVPKLHVEFDYSQSFMIFPGLNASFGGSVFVDVNLQLGFTTTSCAGSTSPPRRGAPRT